MISHSFLLVSLISLFACCNSKKNQFSRIQPDWSGITFNNTIIDNDSLNILDVENLYNGGGVGVGDFNNDGLQDIYFSGNMVSCRLYLNKGDFKFEDITSQAGVDGHGRWGRGVSVVDINNDGLLDIYLSASLHPDSRKRENILYVNKGIDKNGHPRFINEAREYNLADTSHSTMAAFFDYDNDGDLDMYLLVNEIIKSEYPNKFRPILKNGEHPSTGKLYRNDASPSLLHPVFVNVSEEAGVTIEGYGHGVNICDINRDGWKDIYITNDFLSNNILYINNADGTFTDKVRTYFKHTSENSMGQDVIDINNDGLSDIVEADMNPEDNLRKKMMLNPIGYQRYLNNEIYGYQYQYVRNVLQLNHGPRTLPNDSIGDPIFSDIGFFSGIAETDWSWAPVVTDFDNDGYRDIIITNGFPKDVTDHDFIVYRNKANMLASKRELLEQIPEVKISNYAFRNNGDLTFANLTSEWGIDEPSFSNGAAYADFDNDGDMDLAVSNINDEAFIYRNNESVGDHHYLQIGFEGDERNRFGIGAWVEIFYDSGKIQAYENTPYRGYLSTVQNIAHFGLGKTSTVDSIIIRWPGGKSQVLKNISASQLLKLNIENAANSPGGQATRYFPSLFSELTEELRIDLIHKDSDFVDFNIQKLLPHKFSEYGPALAVGDLDGNGLDDIVCGGSMYQSTSLLYQMRDGSFIKKELATDSSRKEDAGILLFDADNDKDIDVYIASGGYEAPANSAAYADRLYINDGAGVFKLNSQAIPRILTSKSCVRSCDFDRDGDLDLFLAGRVEPGMYPKPVSCFLLRNDSKNEDIKFTDVTASYASGLLSLGMVCDGVFSDYDNDGWIDLILAGEWMPIKLLRNNRGRFEDITNAVGLDDHKGWWNSIIPSDIDNDGDMDYVAGNLGLNSFYRASRKYPVAVTASDFDANGSYDAFLSLYLPTSFQDPTRREFPAHLRDESIRQMISLRARFQNYEQYAKASMEQVIPTDQRKNAIRLEANYMQSSILLNDNGNFNVIPLPAQAQFSAINGMVADDFDGDGFIDLLMNCNDYGTEVSVGRYDALNGLLLKGKGNGEFNVLSIMQSGIFLPHNGKGLVKFKHATEGYLIAASQNRGPLKLFRLNESVQCLELGSADAKCVITYKNNRAITTEINHGSSFYSQSGRFVPVNISKVSRVEVIDLKGQKKILRY